MKTALFLIALEIAGAWIAAQTVAKPGVAAYAAIFAPISEALQP